MEIVVAGSEYYAAIADCVASTGYYGPVDPDNMGGTWVVALVDGHVAGCVWLMLDPPSAFLDFLAVSPQHKGRVAVWLLGFVRNLLRERGVTNLRAAIKHTNITAMRLALALGCRLDPNYALLYWAQEQDDGK